jgi:hypothetical protein
VSNRFKMNENFTSKPGQIWHYHFCSNVSQSSILKSLNALNHKLIRSFETKVENIKRFENSTTQEFACLNAFWYTWKKYLLAITNSTIIQTDYLVSQNSLLTWSSINRLKYEHQQYIVNHQKPQNIHILYNSNTLGLYCKYLVRISAGVLVVFLSFSA